MRLVRKWTCTDEVLTKHITHNGPPSKKECVFQFPYLSPIPFPPYTHFYDGGFGVCMQDATIMKISRRM